MFEFYYKLVLHNDVFEVKNAGKLGNGVFALRNVSFEEVQRALPGGERVLLQAVHKHFFPGFLAPVSGDEHDQLERAKHPSLYESGDSCFILFGPLSLVNHDCKSDVAFGKPCKLPTHTTDAAEPAE